MSQATATARPLRSPARAPRRGPTPAPLRVIPARITSTGHGAFASLCALLLMTGLIALLLLNTALAKGSLELGALSRESAQLSDRAGALREEIDLASASGALAESAARLGMVRSNERAYIDLRAGTVSGTAYPASRLQAFSVVTSPTPVPKPKPSTASATPTAPKVTPSASPTGTLGAAGGAATGTPTASPTADQTPAPTAPATTQPAATQPTSTQPTSTQPAPPR